MFPQIPDKLDQLSAAELRELAAEIRKAALAALESTKAEGFDGDRQAVVDEVAAISARRQEIMTLAVKRAAEEQLAEDLADESADPVEPAAETPEPKAPAADEEPEAPEAPEAPAVEGDVVEGNKVEVTAGAGRKIRNHVGSADAGGAGAVTRIVAPQLLAYDGLTKNAGEEFADFRDLSVALLERARNIRPDSDDKFKVARAPARFGEGMQLTDSWMDNMAALTNPELTAQLCAPFTPIYDLACENSLARPVKASLATFGTDQRMGVKVYPSPTLSQITTGVGQWTAADDANPAALKSECARIVCGTPVDFTMYGVYRCITIQNMLQMSFPELVAAWVNRLGAAHARLAEILILEAMSANTVTLFGEHVGFNANVSVVRVLLQYLTNYREIQRWEDGEMDVWLHRGIMTALKADQIARRNTSGDVLRVPTDGEINALFTNAGFTPHWFLDRPSWVTPIPAFATGGKLADFPRNIEMLVAPRGKYALMDRGELNIGVTGNGMYRDNLSNRQNNFTLFFENFEGVVDTNSCPAHLLELNNVCWNGQQIADIVLDCEGDDRIGPPAS